MTMKKRGLGRGLDVLIKSPLLESEHDAEIVTLGVDRLSPNPHQPRHHFDPVALEELAASIKAQGLIQPVLVRPAQEPGQYEIVAGERRWRACQIAGLRQIECLVRKLDDYESMAIALIENLQREDLNPMEEARALNQIKEHFGITQEDLADKIGKSRPAVTNSLRLLKLPEHVQGFLEEGSLSAGHARALLSLTHESDMDALARKILSEGLTVRATEALAKKYKHPEPIPTPRKKNLSQPADILGIRSRIQERYPFAVSCSGTEKQGKIVLSYSTPEERTKITQLFDRLTSEEI